MSFREGLEVFLIVAIIIKFLEKTGNGRLKKFAWTGLGVSLALSILAGFALSKLSKLISTSAMVQLWESGASLVAVGLIITFIAWVIKHGGKAKRHIEEKTALNLSAVGIFVLTTVLVAREGIEVAIFTFAGSYHVYSIIVGGGMAAIVASLAFLSLIKANFKTIFNLTLAYLILQAGYLLGYGVHEGLEALEGLGYLSANNPIMLDAFNLSATIFNHKTGILGLPLNVLAGWHSAPQWIQFVLQYLATFGLFGFWIKHVRSLKKL